MEKYKVVPPFYAKLTYILISLIAIVYIALLAKEIISPLIFSFLFSMLLLPLAGFLEVKLKFPRSISSFVSVLMLLSVIVLVLYLIGAQMTHLADDWSLFQMQLESTLNSFQDWIENRFNIDQKHQVDYVTDAFSKFISSGTAVVGATVLSLSSLMLFLVFTFIYTFFLLLYRKLIFRFFLNVFSDKHAAVVRDVIKETQYMIRKYLIGLLLQMTIISFATATVFYVLDVKYAVLLGLITGIFNVIPYLGIFTALLVSSLITFATSAVFTKVIFVVVALIVIHIIDSNILLPVVVGSKVKINALVTVLGVIAGEMIWGISGMFLSIPVIAILKIIFDRIDGLKPWGMLLGAEEEMDKANPPEDVIN